MAPAVRWTFVVNHSGSESSRGLALALDDGASVALGGPGPLEAATLAVSPRGELLLTAPDLPTTAMKFGRRVELGADWVELVVPPSLERGAPPPTLPRWSLAFEVRATDRQHPFRFARATGERFSHGRHDQNALRCPAPSVARKHIEFFVDAQGLLWANDCQSPGGTWLAQERRRLEGWTPVAPGVELMSGSGVFTRLLEALRTDAT